MKKCQKKCPKIVIFGFGIKYENTTTEFKKKLFNQKNKLNYVESKHQTTWNARAC